MAAIRLHSVSKCYRVHDSPLNSLVGMVAPKMVVPREVWALRDIELEVEPGACIGVIGNNGSGKSTLLSVIGGVVSPTSGTVEVQGEISTLLDLTVGMQRELTGRANIKIIGGLLGLEEDEVQRRTPDIEGFAELGDALERPVKTYSTGMAMRLGFSIALHTDFDVFLVDEVLAVGDSLFHRKCISRMREIHEHEGRTILIASHGLGEIGSLADWLVLLDKGQILSQGPTEDVLAAYWQECERRRNQVGRRATPLKPVNPYGDDLGHAAIDAVRFLDPQGRVRDRFQTGEGMTIEVAFTAKRPVDNPLFRIQIFRNDGVWVHGMNSYRHGCKLGRVEGRGVMRLKYDHINLLEADYFVSIGVWPDEYTSFITDVAFDVHEKAYVFRVVSNRSQGAGIVAQPARWEFLPPGSPVTLEALEQIENNPHIYGHRPPPEHLRAPGLQPPSADDHDEVAPAGRGADPPQGGAEAVAGAAGGEGR